MLVRKKTDRIPVSVTLENGECVEFLFAPLSIGDKTEILGALNNNGEMSPSAAIDFTKKIIAKTLKGQTGMTNHDGSQYAFAFDGQGSLTADCIDDILNTEIATQVVTVAGMFLRGIPVEGALIHPATGLPVAGIEVKKSR